MNPSTNHLIDMSGMDEEKRKRLIEEGYIPVPAVLEAAATVALDGNPDVYVSKRKHPQLAKWAGRKRKAKRRTERLTRRQARR